jgi:tRNA A-37 threonylcarbamoyl transferase component Bud32
MGAVYVAEQLSTGKQRALKLMHAELAWDARLRERFVQEARVGASIDSEHVVEVVGAGIDVSSGTPWLAMELLDGLDLSSLMQQRGPLPVAEVREILSQLCHALAAAHRSGIVHRDLKPQNVFVARSRQQSIAFKVKVLDFGIAKVVAAARGTSQATAVVGTPLWMAPEQTDPNGVVSPASDVWALGLIAFRMLTARWYWTQAVGEASSVMTLMREVLFEPIVPPSFRAGQMGVGHLIPPGFDAWFARCVDRNPLARFRDAGEAMQALEPVLGRGPTALGHAGSLPLPAPPPAGVPPHVYGTTGVPAHTPSPQADFAQVTHGGLGVPAPAKRASSLWVWMVAGIVAVLLAAGGVVLLLALAAVGIDASSTDVAGNPTGDITGTYVIADGTNPGGTGRYYGSVAVQRVSATYQVRWDLSVGPSQHGIGLVSGNLFGVGYAPGGDYAVAVYEIEGGTLRGAYARANVPGRVGREVLVGPTGLLGTYRVTQSEDGLAGEVQIRANGSAFTLMRTPEAGGLQGTGIRKNDRLVVTWARSAVQGGVVAYEIGPGLLDGKWAPLQSPTLGTETLRVQ